MKRSIPIPLLIVFLMVTMSSAAFGADIPRMTKETLKGKIGDANTVVVDVRKGSDWRASENTIKGSVRVDPKKVKDWAKKQDKNKTYVLYCA